MYCRLYELDDDSTCEFVFQAQRCDSGTERYTPFVSVDNYKLKIFPVRASVEDALLDIEQEDTDGRVMRFVKMPNDNIGDEKVLSFTAGCAARLWVDTKDTDRDINHFTKEQLEQIGRIVSELYVGPFSLKHCHRIIDGLKDKIPNLGVIKLGNQYNVAQIFHIEPSEKCITKEGALYFEVTKDNFENAIDEWHQNESLQLKSLYEHLDLPEEALCLYAQCPGACRFAIADSKGKGV